ncbi:MAG: hypothetical protein K0S53_1383 [Bacteroidetes bacterium]|jgi:hypothetical protein|nr:hypothetical protein [Bacteroidota bacterium]
MNKILQLFSALTLVLATYKTNAQLINPGFETWSNDILVPSAMNPNSGNATTGWLDFNYFNHSTLGSSPISVTRCTDTVHSGSYSVRLQTRVYTPTSWGIYSNWGIPFIGHPYNDTLGILFNGNANVTNQTYVPGIPYTQKITQFKFYYQYKPTGNDTAVCRVLLVKQRNPIAGGAFKTNVSTGASGWQQATINLTYVSSATPDTLWVLMSSSSLDKNPKSGSILWIDDVSVTLPTGINELMDTEQEIEIFPNPSTGVFSVRSTESNEGQHLEVYNVLGSKVYFTPDNRQMNYTLDLSHYPKGVYYVKLFRGEKSTTRKIVVQ